MILASYKFNLKDNMNVYLHCYYILFKTQFKF